MCSDVQELQNSSQALQEEREEVKRRLEEATARVLQLEEDLIGVTQKGLQKETELDGSVLLAVGLSWLSWCLVGIGWFCTWIGVLVLRGWTLC